MTDSTTTISTNMKDGDDVPNVNNSNNKSCRRDVDDNKEETVAKATVTSGAATEEVSNKRLKISDDDTAKTTTTTAGAAARSTTTASAAAAITPSVTPTNADNDQTTDKKPPAAAATTKKDPPSSSTTSASQVVFDLATTLGFKAGDKFQVQWELELDEQDEDTGEILNTNTVLQWWDATLLEHDGRTIDGVAIRSLQYVALPKFGFEEETVEDVVFLSRNTLVSPPSLEEIENDNEQFQLDDLTKLTYRRHGQTTVDIDPETVDAMLGGSNNQSGATTTTTAAAASLDQTVLKIDPTSEDALEEQLNQILATSLDKVSSKFTAMPASQQALVGTKIAQMKTTLKHALMEKSKSQRIFTADTIQEVLASVSSSSTKSSGSTKK